MNDIKVGGSFREELKHIRLKSNQSLEFLNRSTINATFKNFLQKYDGKLNKKKNFCEQNKY